MPQGSPSPRPPGWQPPRSDEPASEPPVSRSFAEALATWRSRLIGDGTPATGPGVMRYVKVVGPIEVAGRAANWEAENHYDPLAVAYQVKAITGDAACDEMIRIAKAQYLRYVESTGGNIPAHRNWTRGLRLDYEATGDEVSKAAVLLLSTTAKAAEATDLAPLTLFLEARSLAFALQSQIDARALGQEPRHRTATLMVLALEIIDQWTLPGYWQGTPAYQRGWLACQPMMAGLLARSLIHCHDATAARDEEPDPRILPRLIRLAGWLWETCWLSEAQAFPYWDRDTVKIGAPTSKFDGGQQPLPTPITNPMIGPLYAWLAVHGDPEERATNISRYEAVFIGSPMSGGVDGRAFLSEQKQFNQALFWEPEGLAWREKALGLPDKPEPPSPPDTWRTPLVKLREAIDLCLAEDH